MVKHKSPRFSSSDATKKTAKMYLILGSQPAQSSHSAQVITFLIFAIVTGVGIFGTTKIYKDLWKNGENLWGCLTTMVMLVCLYRLYDVHGTCDVLVI